MKIKYLGYEKKYNERTGETHYDKNSYRLAVITVNTNKRSEMDLFYKIAEEAEEEGYRYDWAGGDEEYAEAFFEVEDKDDYLYFKRIYMKVKRTKNETMEVEISETTAETETAEEVVESAEETTAPEAEQTAETVEQEMKNTMTKGEIRHELAKAKKELKDAWICGEGYDYDQNFIVCYKDGTVLETREANERLPQIGIIGIQFFGTDAHYTVGYEMYNGEKVLIEDESEDACYRVEYLPLTSTEATAETVESVEETPVTESEEQEVETAEETETETETTTVETSEQTEETKDENTHIWVTKEAYFFLKNEMRKQRGFKPLTKKQKERILTHIAKNGMSNKIRLNHNSLGGGDGTKDGRWWGWNVATLKKLLKKAGYSYET